MAKQAVNTDGITSAAKKLYNVNSCINMVFGSMKNVAKKLDSNWTGSAGESARTLMYQIFKGNEARETVLKSYIALLEQKVNPEYITTEIDNTNLKDMFT